MFALSEMAYWSMQRLSKYLFLMQIVAINREFSTLAEVEYSITNMGVRIQPNYFLKVEWTVNGPVNPLAAWNHTQLTLRNNETRTSIRFPIVNNVLSADLNLNQNGVQRGLIYEICIQLVDYEFNYVSNKQIKSFVLPPHAVTNFSATLDYHNRSNDGYPRYISFRYSIPRKSHYTGHRVECGRRNANRKIDAEFSIFFEYKYESSEEENIAQGKPTSLSLTATARGGIELESSYAVDGVIGLNAYSAQTNTFGAKWWMVDLQDMYSVQTVFIYQRQTTCGDSYCQVTLRDVRIFSNSKRPGLDPCRITNSNIQRSYKRDAYGMVGAEIFNPPFRARYLTICLGKQVYHALALNEVKVLGVERPVRMNKLIKIDRMKSPQSGSIDCDIYSLASDEGSQLESIPSTSLLLAPPPLPEKALYARRDDGKDVVRIVISHSALRPYGGVRIHIFSSGREHTQVASGTTEFIYPESLIEGRRYSVVSWTSAVVSAGRVNSNTNLTFEFVAGSEGVTEVTAIRPETTQTSGTEGTTALYIACAQISFITMVFLTYCCCKKYKQKKEAEYLAKIANLENRTSSVGFRLSIPHSNRSSMNKGETSMAVLTKEAHGQLSILPYPPSARKNSAKQKRSPMHLSNEDETDIKTLTTEANNPQRRSSSKQKPSQVRKKN